MTTIGFDTQAYVESLTDAGVPDAQAKAHGRALQKVMAAQEPMTKTDIRELELAVKNDIQTLQMGLHELKTRSEAEIKIMREGKNAFRWFFGLLVAFNLTSLAMLIQIFFKIID
uniref:DUF1640 domain-containing protein n=1 Tax=Candidatus Kentrum sp. MB TaxID=2138164 RepID=A0A451B781_9GAMM|nr:MAG: hypothetical protein BECKMB1821G_GA0114241_100271 [Candidatus Kentron sp. MB]VFK28898.1 MAG: hypothetical protein BECKMB1821I_GA0114274_100777 [Candidatus Kentron sp. MB]VFK74145.1 MAG: hypothetical protein BECKMB1821H_GA0114242_100176 [Candidatus Kentron sp. MB]